jgi:hypothetical protein
VRAGVDALDLSPARKWRTRGRIEQKLLDGEFSVRPNRPKTFARYHTIPQKVPNVSIYDKEPGYYMILSRIIQDPANGLRRIPLPRTLVNSAITDSPLYWGVQSYLRPNRLGFFIS